MGAQVRQIRFPSPKSCSESIRVPLSLPASHVGQGGVGLGALLSQTRLIACCAVPQRLH